MVVEFVALAAVAVAVAALLRIFVVQLVVVPSDSMAPTLAAGDRVLAEKLSPLRRGAVVVVADPGGWAEEPRTESRAVFLRPLEWIGVLPDDSADLLVLRVIGLPGDQVMCCTGDGRIAVNGLPLNEQGYRAGAPGGAGVAAPLRFDVVVPADRVFLLGDDRIAARDSRCHLADVRAGMARGQNAFVPIEQIRGRAVAVALPFAHRRLLPVPATFGPVPAGVDPSTRAQLSVTPKASC